MAGSIKFETKPTLEVVVKRLEERRKKMADMRAPYARAATFLDQWVQKNIKTEGGNVGGWAPFADSTLEAIDKYDPNRAPPKLLQKTGRLRQSFLPFASNRDGGIGSDLPYAKMHHEGTGNAPARRLLPKRKEVLPDIRRVMQEHVKESLQ